MRWVGTDGWTVEAVVKHGRPLLRVRQYGFHEMDAATVDEVAALFDLADLVEVAELRSEVRLRGTARSGRGRPASDP